ncbi:hypothetical protein GCM10027422_08670 [Hymenobacter arcticus]
MGWLQLLFCVAKAESRFVRLNFSYNFGNKNRKASLHRATGPKAKKARLCNQGVTGPLGRRAVVGVATVVLPYCQRE